MGICEAIHTVVFDAPSKACINSGNDRGPGEEFTSGLTKRE
jgi:hypothetical protein